MPLPLKTLREASIELGIPESEIRMLVESKKVRALLKKGRLAFAPDEIARIKRQRKTLPESAIRSSTAQMASEAKPAPPKRPPPRKVGL